MVVTVFTCLQSFNKAKRLNGKNWPHWKQEFSMIFMPLRLVKHMSSDAPRPSEKDAGDVWDELEESAVLALYSTMDDSLQARFVPPATTSRTAWKNLCAEFEGNTRAQRMEFKRELYRPRHDPEKPIADYIQGIVSAAGSLTALGHTIAPADIVDSIIMNLDESWTLVYTLLTTQAHEPKLEEVKAALSAHEKHNPLREMSESAHAVRAGGRRRKSRSRSRSRRRSRSRSRRRSHSRPRQSGGFDWLNTRDRDVCHRCGRAGHRSSRCMADMPDWVKDKIMQEVTDRKDARDAEAHVAAPASPPPASSSRRPAGWAHHVHAASDTEDDDEDDLDAHAGYYVEGDEDDDGNVTLHRVVPRAHGSRLQAHIAQASSSSSSPGPGRLSRRARKDVRRQLEYMQLSA